MKYIKNNDSVSHIWCGQVFSSGYVHAIPTSEGSLWANDSILLEAIASGLAEVSDGTDIYSDLNLAINFLKDYYTPNPKTPDNRDLIAVNRIPPGYTVSVTGRADNITNGTYGNGNALKMTYSNKTVRFQVLDHWYAIGGRMIWEGASLDDYVDVILKAPASTGLTNVTGDYTKYNIGGPYNMIIPVTPGAGNWSMDLTAKLTNTQILKATPVPQAGNTGWFDYDSATNVLTRNMTQTGGYNLYDFEVSLFRFANMVWGRKQDGAESILEASDVVGKLLYNSWVADFSLTSTNENIKVGGLMTIAAKKNI